MDTTKHTVTIPMADYLEIEDNKKKIETFAAHLNVMQKAGVLINKGAQLNRTPIDCVVYTDSISGRIDISFKY